jgi:hypothetical protein
MSWTFDSFRYAIGGVSINSIGPTVSLTNTTNNLAEDTDTSSAIKIADIVITDDGFGTNVLSLSGADAAHFEIVGTELRLRAGTSLDFETKDTYDVTVEVDDAAIPGTPDHSVDHTLSITDVNEAPSVSLANVVASLAEDTDTSGQIRIADIVITDDALGTNDLTLAGADAADFIIVGNELRLRAGTSLNYEVKDTYDVTVEVDDSSLGGAPDDTAAHSLGITDVNETPTTTGIADVVVDEDAASTVIDLRAIFDDEDEGAISLLHDLLSNTNASLFEAVTIDAAAGTITLDYAKDQFGTADLTLRATDTGALSVQSSFTVTVNPVNDAPVMQANVAVPVTQAESVKVSASWVKATDVDNTASEIVFTIESGPSHGVLTLDGVELAKGDTITQADIDTGRLEYQQDGSATLDDSFDVVVSDGAGGVIKATISVDVDPIHVADPAPPEAPAATEPEAEAETTDEPVETSSEAVQHDALVEFEQDLEEPVESAVPVEETEEAEDDAPSDAPPAPPAEAEVVVADATAAIRVVDVERSDDVDALIAPPVETMTSVPAAMVERLASITEQLRQELDTQAGSMTIRFGAAASASGALAVSYTIWMVRGGTLLASVMSALPVWRLLDPLAVLETRGAMPGDQSGFDARRQEEDRRVQSLFD